MAGTPHEPQLVACGQIDLSRQDPFERRLSAIHSRLSEIVERHRPSEAAVEAPFHGASARSALQLAHARGVVLAVLGAAGVPVTEYAPATIKKAVTGNGRAEKVQVQAMVGRLIVGSGPVPSGADIADAIAAALCHLTAAGPGARLRAELGRRNRPRP